MIYNKYSHMYVPFTCHCTEFTWIILWTPQISWAVFLLGVKVFITSTVLKNLGNQTSILNITQILSMSCCYYFLFSQNYSVVWCWKVLISVLLFLFSLFPLLLVTVCPCNVRGNCKMAAKQLQGMPTIQSAVGILLGTFAVIGEHRGW